jgi:hypothetical protein
MTLLSMDVLKPVSKEAFKFTPGYVHDFHSQCLSQLALATELTSNELWNMAVKAMSSLLSAKLTEQEDVSRLLGYRLKRVGSTCSP